MSNQRSLADRSCLKPEPEVSETELSELIAQQIRQLPELHRKVVALRYHEGLGLKEIARALGVCRSFICQIHAEAIAPIRSAVERRMPRP